MTFDPTTQDKLFFSKFSDWSYEREWRVVTPLRFCHQPDDGALYLKDVPRHHIRAIVCGWRIALSEISTLQAKVKNVNPDVEWIHSKFENGKFKFESDF
jgi:hypothetical protein